MQAIPIAFNLVRDLYRLNIFWLQVTRVLKNRLRDLGVEVNVKTFEEDFGIVELGEDPFVSFIYLPVRLTLGFPWNVVSSMHGTYCG